jgi:hypothetical protein
MSLKPIEQGSFVVHEKHPEHGLGRVVSTGAFATRVLFQHGGLRVFRAGDPSALKSVNAPAAADVAVLAAKEAALHSGLVDAPVGDPKPVAPAPKAKKKKKEAAPS